MTDSGDDVMARILQHLTDNYCLDEWDGCVCMLLLNHDGLHECKPGCGHRWPVTPE